KNMKNTCILKLVLLVILCLSVVFASTKYVYPKTLYYKPNPVVPFSFASFYNDHMVLQKGPKQSIIWGYHQARYVGITLKVSNHVKIYSTMTTRGPFIDRFIWKIVLDPIIQPGPYDITVSTNFNETILIKDVLFGDVWLCSGQSNMALKMNYVFNSTKELAHVSAYKNKIRIFQVGEVESARPLFDLAPGKGIQLPWSQPTPESVSKFSATCWLYGRNIQDHLGYPVGLIETCWGGTSVETWSSSLALSHCNIDLHNRIPLEIDFGSMSRKYVPTTPSHLWNSMVHPFINMTIYGTIWYQGEANAKRPDNYNCTFPAMIDDWRGWFYAGTHRITDPLFPFGFVQLGPSRPWSVGNFSVGFPDIRWHQTADYGYVPNPRLKNIFMGEAMDLRDDNAPSGPIHPRDKEDVGLRLSLSGRAVAYGEQGLKFQGPMVTHITEYIAEKTMVLSFDNGKHPITVRSVDGFEVFWFTYHTQGDMQGEY
ncbi:unnamed protein product, partial [Owenia fusiformis]